MIILIPLIIYFIWAYYRTPKWMILHIWIHVIYIFFPFEPQWLIKLHDWSGDKL